MAMLLLVWWVILADLVSLEYSFDYILEDS